MDKIILHLPKWSLFDWIQSLFGSGTLKYEVVFESGQIADAQVEYVGGLHNLREEHHKQAKQTIEKELGMKIKKMEFLGIGDSLQ